jgi:hypothetical protein
MWCGLLALMNVGLSQLARCTILVSDDGYGAQLSGTLAYRVGEHVPHSGASSNNV